ncbi:MAG: HU family DNA-binding protein [Acidimicrobiales bacterium]
MTKSELVAEIAQQAEVTQAQAGACVDAFFNIVASQVGSGGDVSVPGYIKFSQTHRKARKGRNPRTGEEIQVPATMAVKIQAGSKLKAAAKGN